MHVCVCVCVYVCVCVSERERERHDHMMPWQEGGWKVALFQGMFLHSRTALVNLAVERKEHNRLLAERFPSRQASQETAFLRNPFSAFPCLAVLAMLHSSPC